MYSPSPCDMSGGNPPHHGLRPPDPPRTYASTARGAMSDKVRAYAEFVSKQKKERNLIEIRFKKERKIDGDKVKYIDLETISDYLFNQLEINPDDILEIDLNTGRWDVKQVLFKPGVSTDHLISDFPYSYKDYLVSVHKLSVSETKVTFRNVPAYIPDMELLNLCALYGKVEGGITREKVTLTSDKGKIAIPTSTRSAMVKLLPGKSFLNFYWLDGPLPGDMGRRITVLHNGQTKQCFNCLATADTGCLGLGNGKSCEEVGTARTKMSDYMRSFKEATGY